jgi:hypothetical protein
MSKNLYVASRRHFRYHRYWRDPGRNDLRDAGYRAAGGVERKKERCAALLYYAKILDKI